ncbi:MAG: aspartyl protease family protein [bacterium]|jgi:hypothetical protein
MNRVFKSFWITGLCLFVAVSAYSQTGLTDPYEILNKHIEINGGLERLKAERSQYMEGTLAVAGLSGTIKVWTKKPDLSRADVDLGILKQFQGSNPEFDWVLDSNGKLQKITTFDEPTLKRKELKKRMAELEYLDPQSEIFKVSYDGMAEVEGKKCYAIKIANTLNSDIYTSFINAENFMLEKTSAKEGEDGADSYYGDYREIEGLKVAFKIKEIQHLTGQTQEITISEYRSNPEIEPSQFYPPGESRKDYRFTNGVNAENIPFRFSGNHLYIPVTVNCKERYWILDTGAGMSVISKEFAEELGLELKGDMKGKGAGGSVDISFATLPSLSLRGIEFDQQTVAAIDMTELNRLIDIESAGILGFDFLSRFVTKVDYAAQLVSFYDPETFKYEGPGVELPLYFKNSVFMVSATLDNEHSGSWLFDLGASNTSLDGGYALRKGFSSRRGVERLGRGAGQEFLSKGVRCKSLELGGFIIENPIIGFEISKVDTAHISDEIGTLGNSTFRHFVIYCDYHREKVILEKGANFNKEYPVDRSGLQLKRGSGKNIEVLFVAGGTPAEKAGFQTADIIKSINGIRMEHLGELSQLRLLLSEKAGTEYSFAVERGGKELRLKLKLENLL